MGNEIIHIKYGKIEDRFFGKTGKGAAFSTIALSLQCTLNFSQLNQGKSR